MSDTLVMPTLLSQGYGQIAKMVTVDERMTCEAKCIYALLASFSGGGTTAFPSIDFQCRVLHICRERYYKHRRFLTALGYLTVSQGKDGGKMLNNRYALSFAPKPDPAELAKLKEEWGPKLDKYISPALLASYGACEVPREADPAQVGGENGFSQNPRSAPAVGKPDHGADLGKQQNPRSAPQSEFPTAENPTTIINSVIIGEKQACRPVFPAPPGAGEPAAESCSAPSKAGRRNAERRTVTSPRASTSSPCHGPSRCATEKAPRRPMPPRWPPGSTRPASSGPRSATSRPIEPSIPMGRSGTSSS